MNTSVNIDFADLQQFLKIKKENSIRYIFCFIRKKYLVITPEEIVRQLFILYLIKIKHYPKNKIAVEKQVLVNGLSKRFDIMVLDKTFQPWMLIECKAPNVRIEQQVFNQVARYNTALNTDLIIVTNGKETYCCKVNRNSRAFEFLGNIPNFGEN